MKRIFWGLAVFFLMGTVFAGVSITPSDLNISSMYGGDTVITLLTVINNDSWINSVIITIGWTDEDGNTNGFDAYLSNNNFQLYPNQSKDINLILKANPNIKPGEYTINIFAEGSGTAPDPAPPPSNPGNGGIYYGPRPIDNNDQNIVPPPVIVPPTEYDDNGCEIDSGVQWCPFKNRCINTMDEECIPLDINIDIDMDTNWSADGSNETEYTISPLLISGIIVIIIIVGATIIIYKYKKGGKII